MNERNESKESQKIMSLSVFIGVYRWLKEFFHHRYTPMNTDKSLKAISSNRWRFDLDVEVTA